jgi:hypothetical protein
LLWASGPSAQPGVLVGDVHQYLSNLPDGGPAGDGGIRMYPVEPEMATCQRVPVPERGNPISPRTVIWHSALEFLLTFVLLFGVVTIVRWVIGPSAVARAIPPHPPAAPGRRHRRPTTDHRADPQPGWPRIGRPHEPRDLARDVALRGLPRCRPVAVYGGPAGRLSTRGAGCRHGLGQRSRTAPGVLRRTPASRRAGRPASCLAPRRSACSSSCSSSGSA